MEDEKQRVLLRTEWSGARKWGDSHGAVRNMRVMTHWIVFRCGSNPNRLGVGLFLHIDVTHEPKSDTGHNQDQY